MSGQIDKMSDQNDDLKGHMSCYRRKIISSNETCSIIHVTSQSLISIYYALVYPYLTYGCVLWGKNYEALLSQLVRLQNKVVRIINNVPLRDHITPHYVNLGLIKFPDIVKLHTCQLIYDHLNNKKSSNLNLSLVSEQHH